MLSRLRNSDSNDLGPGAIIEAVYDSNDVYDVDTATMGTPRLRDFGGLQTNYKVIIPLDAGVDAVDLPPFVFDLPADPVLSDGDFGRLSRLYGIETIEEIGNLAGQSVPLAWKDGYPAPELNRLEGDQDE